MDSKCNVVVFSNKAYNAIIDETFKQNPLETGGLLLGHRLGGDWIVMEVTPPGYNSPHQTTYFEHDKIFNDYIINSVSTKYHVPLELLGQWHRHPGSMDVFSATDDETNLDYAKIHPCGAISGLVNVDPNFRLTMRHVSNPLHYDIVDVEVGDDLIPEDYFRLRHYPEKGLNPAPPSEKKNEWTNIESMSEQKSSSTDNTVGNILTKKNNLINLKTIVLALLSAFFLSFFVTMQTSQNIVGKNKCKQRTLFELVYSTSDADGICISPAKEEKTGIDKKTKKEVDVQEAKQAVYINQSTSINIVKYSYLAISVLMISLIFVPLGRKEYLYCAIGCFVLAFLVVLLSPIKFSIALFAFTTLLGLLLCLVSIGILKLIEYVKAYQNLPWYHRRTKLFNKEDAAIKNIEPKAECGFEDGKVVYTVVTDRRIAGQEHSLAYQMVYSPDYLNDGTISIYFIMPDLSDMLANDNELKLSNVKMEDDGDLYLEFVNKKDHKNGAQIIEYLYKRIDLYNIRR